MAADLHWVHTFCLTCDRQTDGATYCSETCRLADYEDTTSSTSSGPNSPSWASPASAYPWSSSPAMGPTSSSSHRKFVLSPAYDFSNPQPYGSTPTLYHDNYYLRQHGSHHHHNAQQAGSRRPPATATSPSTAAYGMNHMALPPTTAAATTSGVTYHHVLSPSSSQSSLSSMRSNTSMGAAGALGALSAFATGGSGYLYNSGHFGGSSASSSNGDLSGKARSELRKYASSLEQCKLQRQLLRRRSC